LTAPQRVVVWGAGAVGTRAARQLLSSPEVAEIVVVDREPRRAEDVARALGSTARAHAGGLDALDGAAAVLVAAPLNGAPAHAARPKVRARASPVEQAVRDGCAVVCTSDRITDVEVALGLGSMARATGATVVAGAAMAPGLTDVLARWAAADFGEVEEVHVAKAGTGGPACARQHHRALRGEALDWRDGQWARRAGGSGRELVWFPGPLGGQDCYRAGLPDALLLVPAFRGVRRVTARLAATRRDRLTGALPMLRPPHPEGEDGAVRVEVRGRKGDARHAAALGSEGRPAVTAAAVAAVSVLWALRGDLPRGRAGGLAELVGDAGAFLAELAQRGVRVEVFEGGSARVRG
jgi:hypothetical protein